MELRLRILKEMLRQPNTHRSAKEMAMQLVADQPKVGSEMAFLEKEDMIRRDGRWTFLITGAGQKYLEENSKSSGFRPEDVAEAGELAPSPSLLDAINHLGQAVQELAKATAILQKLRG